jgi:hypothetical protein
MADPSPIELGTLIEGEIPDPLEYSFQDWQGKPLPLPPPYTAVFQWRERHASSPSQRAAAVSDTAQGEVTYVWDGSEFASPGHYRGHVWAGNGGVNRYASVPITWTVACGLGTTPAV